MPNRIRLTKDGSQTLYVEALDETYHSIHGALQEAEHVFIQHGLKALDRQEKIQVFEMGFGTALNALLTFKHAQKSQEIYYCSIEKYPVSKAEWPQLNYWKSEADKRLFEQLHLAPWNEDVQINPKHILNKIEGDIKLWQPPAAQFDLVYYDAFGPRAQPDLWGIPVLEKFHILLKSGGMLVTYCAQGQFKRNLKQLGFNIEELPGPPGKRQMTRAIKV